MQIIPALDLLGDNAVRLEQGDYDRVLFRQPIEEFMDYSEAFCPSPGNADCGHAVDLQARLNARPAREILHPWIRFGPGHVFRVGTIRRPLPANLNDARGAPLLTVRDLAKRTDYASLLFGPKPR